MKKKKTVFVAHVHKSTTTRFAGFLDGAVEVRLAPFFRQLAAKRWMYGGNAHSKPPSPEHLRNKAHKLLMASLSRRVNQLKNCNAEPALYAGTLAILQRLQRHCCQATAPAAADAVMDDASKGAPVLATKLATFQSDIPGALLQLAHLMSSERTDHHSMEHLFAIYTRLAPLDTLPYQIAQSRVRRCPHATDEQASTNIDGFCDICEEEIGGMFEYGSNDCLPRWYAAAVAKKS